MNRPNIPEGLIQTLKKNSSIVVLTGAGISAESGIPTFRDAQEGLWAEFNPQELATPEAFAENPKRVTEWYDSRRLKCARVEPNVAHRALAALEKYFLSSGKDFCVVTQNVDRLHQRSGSTRVIEYHGTLWVWFCVECYKEISLEGRNAFDVYPPRCDCGGLLRPNVVWFGEMIPDQALRETAKAMRNCQFFFSIGTSAVVQPAAGLAWEAKKQGAKIVEINLEPTPVSDLADWTFHDKACNVLPGMANRVMD